jgi:hypothetical protein
MAEPNRTNGNTHHNKDTTTHGQSSSKRAVISETLNQRPFKVLHTKPLVIA